MLTPHILVGVKYTFFSFLAHPVHMSGNKGWTCPRMTIHRLLNHEWRMNEWMNEKWTNKIFGDAHQLLFTRNVANETKTLIFWGFDFSFVLFGHINSVKDWSPKLPSPKRPDAETSCLRTGGRRNVPSPKRRSPKRLVICPLDQKISNPLFYIVIIDECIKFQSTFLPIQCSRWVQKINNSYQDTEHEHISSPVQLPPHNLYPHARVGDLYMREFFCVYQPHMGVSILHIRSNYSNFHLLKQDEWIDYEKHHH